MIDCRNDAASGPCDSSLRPSPTSPVSSGLIGFEVELLAPAGVSRADLAAMVARRIDGSVQRVFHADTEPSLVPGRPVFHHLSLGYEVLDGRGVRHCQLVDDVTIRDDLATAAVGEHDFFRIISDDVRFLRLAEQLIDPHVSLNECLKPLASIFGVEVVATPSGRFSVADQQGASVAMAVPESPGRERVCEIITPPLGPARRHELDHILDDARALGFTTPIEAAVHLHLDAEPWRSGPALRRLVQLFANHRELLWESLGTNEQCRRLGPLPDEVVDLVSKPGFDDAPWVDIEHRLRALPLTKYCDLNLVNLVNRTQGKDTVEVRLLPGCTDARTIMAKADVIDRLLHHLS